MQRHSKIGGGVFMLRVFKSFETQFRSRVQKKVWRNYLTVGGGFPERGGGGCGTAGRIGFIQVPTAGHRGTHFYIEKHFWWASRIA